LAVTKIGVTQGGNIKNHQGLAADEKPVDDIGSGSAFHELDTGDDWIYDANNVNSATTNGWWLKTPAAV